MKDFFKDSIYENVHTNQNWISNDWDKYKKKYNSGYSSSSYWLDIEDDKEYSFKTKADLNFALVQVSKCVNLIRHKFGVGERKALFVKWADSENLYNSLNDDYVFLSPSPLLSRSNLSIKQRYDVIVGQALLSSVQKHIIPARLYNFISRLEQMKNSNQNIDLKIDIIVDDEKLFFKNESYFFSYVPKIIKRERNTTREIAGIDHIEYPNRKTFFTYSNVTISRFLEYYNIWRAIEQDITEKALSNEYKGSTSYLFAHRDFYLDKKFNQVLEEVVQYFDMEWLPKIWHLLIINNILNSKKITNLHPVYEKIQKIANDILIVDPLENSESRFASVAELIGKVCDLMEELKLSDANLSGNQGSDLPQTEEKTIPSSLKKQLEKVIDDVSKSGLGEALTKASQIISVKSHKSLVNNTREFDVSDQNSLRLFELETLSSGMRHIPFNIIGRSNIWAKEKYDRLASTNKRFIDYLKETLLIRSFDFTAEDYSMKSGILDENSLWKLSMEDSENIFYQRCLPKTCDNVHITVVFDNSGSMSTKTSNAPMSRIEICNNIAVVLREVISTLPNVKLDIYSFADFEFYSYDDNFYGIANQHNYGGTNEGLAVAKAIHNMELFRINNPESFYGKRYLIAVGDGITDLDAVKKTNDFIRNNTNIKFFHIGIDNAYTQEHGEIQYGKGNFAIVPSENLMHNLCTTIVKILL